MTQRWLGLDLGERFWGIAVARAGEPPAQPLEVVAARDRIRAFNRLRQRVQEYRVATIVAGVPLAHGNWSRASEKIYQIIRWLVPRMPELEWRFIDESLTTLDATLEGTPKRRPDDRAAAMILERALYHDAPLWRLEDLEQIRAARTAKLTRENASDEPQ